MTDTSLNQRNTNHSEANALPGPSTTNVGEDYDCCARVNAWQQVMQRKTGQPLEFRW